LVSVLPLALTQVVEGVPDALVVQRQFLQLCPALRFLPDAVAGIAVHVLHHPVLQSKRSDLQRLPPNFPEVLLSQRELLHIFGFFDDFNGSFVHAFLLFGRRERLQVLEEDLVLAECHESLEEVVDGDFDVVVVVALHPLLDEVVVAVDRQHDAVATVRQPREAVPDACVGLEDGALLDPQHPAVGLNGLGLHHLVQRLRQRGVFPVAEHEGRDEEVLLDGVDVIAEDAAVVAVEDGRFLPALASPADDKGLVLYLLGGEVVREELGDDEVDNVVVADTQDIRHLHQRLPRPELVQLLLSYRQSALLQLATARQHQALEVVYVLHF
jgi:hypothetical protein